MHCSCGKIIIACAFSIGKICSLQACKFGSIIMIYNFLWRNTYSRIMRWRDSRGHVFLPLRQGQMHTSVHFCNTSILYHTHFHNFGFAAPQSTGSQSSYVSWNCTSAKWIWSEVNGPFVMTIRDCNQHCHKTHDQDAHFQVAANDEIKDRLLVTWGFVAILLAVLTKFLVSNSVFFCNS